MGDVSSGMASTVIQLYIKEILDAFLHYDVSVRRAALKVIQLILQQGLVHPVQVHYFFEAHNNFNLHGLNYFQKK